MSATATSDGGPVYFWMPNQCDYGFLSQWYPAPFTTPAPSPSSAPPMSFLNTEQYMMYHKAILFQDTETAEKVMAATTPPEHKALGRQVENFDREKWAQHRVRIVEEGNWNKFNNKKDGPELTELLMKTGRRELVEVSRWMRRAGRLVS